MDTRPVIKQKSLKVKITQCLELDAKAYIASLEEQKALKIKIEEFRSHRDKINLFLSKHGICFGLALCHAAMGQLKKEDWWEQGLVAVANWDGTPVTLTKELKSFILLAVEYIIPSHASSDSKSIFHIKGLKQSNILNPTAHTLSKSKKKQSFFEFSVKDEMDDKYKDITIQERLIAPISFENAANSELKKRTEAEEPALATPPNSETTMASETAEIAEATESAESTESKDETLLEIKATMLAEMLDEEVMANHMCLFHSGDHALDLKYKNGKWVIYHANYDHSELTTITQEFDSKKKAAAEIIRILKSSELVIEVASISKEKTLEKSNFMKVYRNYLQASGDTMLSDLFSTPYALPTLLKIAESKEQVKLRKVLATQLESSGKLLQSVIREDPGLLSALDNLSKLYPDEIPNYVSLLKEKADELFDGDSTSLSDQPKLCANFFRIAELAEQKKLRAVIARELSVSGLFLQDLITKNPQSLPILFALANTYPSEKPSILAGICNSLSFVKAYKVKTSNSADTFVEFVHTVNFMDFIRKAPDSLNMLVEIAKSNPELLESIIKSLCKKNADACLYELELKTPKTFASLSEAKGLSGVLEKYNKTKENTEKQLPQIKRLSQIMADEKFWDSHSKGGYFSRIKETSLKYQNNPIAWFREIQEIVITKALAEYNAFMKDSNYKLPDQQTLQLFNIFKNVTLEDPEAFLRNEDFQNLDANYAGISLHSASKQDPPFDLTITVLDQKDTNVIALDSDGNSPLNLVLQKKAPPDQIFPQLEMLLLERANSEQQITLTKREASDLILFAAKNNYPHFIDNLYSDNIILIDDFKSKNRISLQSILDNIQDNDVLAILRFKEITSDHIIHLQNWLTEIATPDDKFQNKAINLKRKITDFLEDESIPIATRFGKATDLLLEELNSSPDIVGETGTLFSYRRADIDYYKSIYSILSEINHSCRVPLTLPKEFTEKDRTAAHTEISLGRDAM